MSYSHITSPGGADHVIDDACPAFMAKNCVHGVVRGSIVQVTDEHSTLCCEDYGNYLWFAVARRDLTGSLLNTIKSGRGEVVKYLDARWLSDFQPITKAAKEVVKMMEKR